MRKSIKLILSLILCFCMVGAVALFVACGPKTPESLGEIPYEAEMLSKQEDVIEGYNNELFYVNTLDFEVADPTIVYISDENSTEYGYFYAYGTSDEIGCHGFQAWRSKDLSHWECMGVAFQPDFEVAWAFVNYWAPEIIYDDGIYYLFYNAYHKDKNNRLYLSVAYAREPYGPFVSPTTLDADGKQLTPAQPVFDFTVDNPEIAKLVADNPGLVREQCLDASPFIDPVTKKKYMYFSYYNSYSEGSFIYGVEMKDWFTPDYSTLAMITAPGYVSVEAYKVKDVNQRLSEGGVNEGPFMMCKDGKYYMTLSVFGYTDPNYRVIQAIGDSPLGSFTKIPDAEGGRVISTNPMWKGNLVSAGHHCFFTCGDELFIGYHTFKDRDSISGGRALAVDKVIWAKNQNGVTVLHSNGPTYSVQALPEFISGYKNIATSAEIKATNTADDSDVKYLNDELIKYQDFDVVTEYHAKEGVSTITLTWDSWKTVRALMIFNSYSYDNTFVQIQKIEFEVKNSKGKTTNALIKNLEFDWDWHMNKSKEMEPGGAAIAEFNELPVKSIKISFVGVAGAETAISEIVVLGKDEACAGVDSLKPYSYEANVEAGSPHVVKESENFGSVENTPFETWWGFDLSHDDGTEDAYIEQTGCTDQYVYFNDVFDAKFYVEAEFTVTKSNSFGNDQWPKFGIAMSAYDKSANINNTLFFYVDAANNYTKQAVGCAQRKLDGTDWDWDTTEQLVSVPGIQYKNGNYVKLAVLRNGDEFYMFCNDKLAIFYDQFNIFTKNRNAAAGFLSFNTGMKIRNYSITTDSDFIDSEVAKYEHSVKGENIGRADTNVTTSGWDLSGDRGEHPVLEGSGDYDQYAFFKNVYNTASEVTADITVKEVYNNDGYPKFGIVLRNGVSTFFFYVDASGGLTTQRVGYVVGSGSGEFNGDHWAKSVEKDYELGSYTNGNKVNLSVKRDGTAIKCYVNGELVFDVENQEGLAETEPCTYGFLTFNLHVVISDYSIIINE